MYYGSSKGDMNALGSIPLSHINVTSVALQPSTTWDDQSTNVLECRPPCSP